MSRIEKKKLSQLKTLRILCVVMPLLSATLRFIVFHTLRIEDIQSIMLLSCSAIIMLQFFLEESKMVLILTSITLLWDFIDLCISTILSEGAYNIPYILYSLIIIIPIQICIIPRVKNKVRDQKYISSTISGCDAAMGYLRISFAIIFQPLAISSVFIIYYKIIPKIILILLFILTSVFFLFLYIRSIKNMRLICKTHVKDELNNKIGLSFEPKRKSSDNDELNSLYNRMCDKMKEEKLYLSPSFTIDDLSRILYTNRGYLSKTINRCTGMNFNTLINNYRVHHAMELFKKNPKMKVTDLMGLSGFNNPVTFNNAFKIVMKTTPGDWCNSYRENTQILKEKNKSNSEPLISNNIIISGK